MERPKQPARQTDLPSRRLDTQLPDAYVRARSGPMKACGELGIEIPDGPQRSEPTPTSSYKEVACGEVALPVWDIHGGPRTESIRKDR